MSVVRVQVLLEVSLHVSLGVLRLLLSDVECSSKWFTAAVKCCLDANLLDVAVALCYLLIPHGKYLQFLSCKNMKKSYQSCTVKHLFFAAS